MRMFFNIQSKLKVALSLLVMVLLLLGGVLLERNFFSQVNSASSSIYNDRLIPATSVYQLSDHITQRRFIIENYLEEGKGSKLEVKHQLEMHERATDSIVTAFEKTYLVQVEKESLELLQQHLETYSLQESALITAGGAGYDPQNLDRLSARYENVREELRELSEIQATVGQKLFSESESLASSAGVVSYLQVVALIVTCLIVQVLVLASRAIKSPLRQKHNLN